MAYVPLRVAGATPPVVADFVRNHVEMQFHDVHSMLRLPMKARGLDAGCNFAAAGFLLSLVAGLSTALYRQTGYDGARFKGLLETYYPWELEPADAVRDPEEASEILWTFFRNPVAHALGVDTRQVGKGPMKTVVLWRDKRRVRLGIARGRTGRGLSVRQLAKLEASRVRPPFARATILRGPRRRTLIVDGLYWGVRELVARVTQDKLLMRDARKFLRRWRDAV